MLSCQGDRYLTIAYPTTSVNHKRPSRNYRIAGINILANQSINELSVFQCKRDRSIDKRQHTISDLEALVDQGQLAYQGKGWIGNAWRDVFCKHSAYGFFLQIEATGQYWLKNNGKQIDLRMESEQTGNVINGLLGPALIMSLALQNIWCMHASAVKIDNEAVIFLGDSGFGKSTLAAYFLNQQLNNGKALADDILPISVDTAGVHAHPYFPQLKWPANIQYCSGPESIPLKAIVVLDDPVHLCSDVRLSRIEGQSALLTLLRHTVAARLFNQSLLQKQMHMASQVSELIAIYRLSYPRKKQFLPRFYKILFDTLQSGSNRNG